jgi:transposase
MNGVGDRLVEQLLRDASRPADRPRAKPADYGGWGRKVRPRTPQRWRVGRR